MTYTKGPWRVGKSKESIVSDVRSKDFGNSYLEFKTYGGFLIAESVSSENIHLIAAAPDLLGALEDMLEMSDEPPERNCSCHLCPPCSDCVDYSGIRDAIKKARTAIASARGQS